LNSNRRCTCAVSGTIGERLVIVGNPHGNRHHTRHLLNQEFMQALLLNFRHQGKKAIEAGIGAEQVNNGNGCGAPEAELASSRARGCTVRYLTARVRLGRAVPCQQASQYVRRAPAPPVGGKREIQK
jgi:hypothetical protein